MDSHVTRTHMEVTHIYTNTITRSTHANEIKEIIGDTPAEAVVDSLAKVPVRKKSKKDHRLAERISVTNFASSQLESCSPSREDEEVGSNASLFPRAPTQQCILLAPQHTTLHEHSLCSHTHHAAHRAHSAYISHCLHIEYTAHLFTVSCPK